MMFSRILGVSFALTLAAAIVACQSSGAYGTPRNAAAGTALGLTGAAVSRAMGGCYAQCLPGTYCNPKNGLCERAHTPAMPPKPTGGTPPLTANASYPPGHESEIPPLSDDAGCDPSSSSADGGSLACEMDASTSH